MDENIAKMQAELEAAGYQTQTFQSPQGLTVIFDYELECGNHVGETIKVGISGPDGSYPEYPPHWVHVSPPISDGKSTHAAYQGPDGQTWLPMSRPPNDFWDKLKTKNMETYIQEHLRRLWKDV